VVPERAVEGDEDAALWRADGTGEHGDDSPRRLDDRSAGTGPGPSRGIVALVAGAGALVGSLVTVLVAGTGDEPSGTGAATTVATLPATSLTVTVEPTARHGSVLPEATFVATSVAPPVRTTTQLGTGVLPVPTLSRVVGLSLDGHLVSIVLDTGQIDVTDVPTIRSGYAGFVVPGSGRTLVGSWQERRAYVVSDEGVPTDAPAVFATSGPIAPSDARDSAWVVSVGEDPQTSGVELISFDGESLAGPFDLAGGWASWSDQRGGVLFTAPGGTYSVSSSGVRRLTSGQVLAVGANHVVAKECDDRLVCSLWLIERDTDVRSELPADLLLGENVFLPESPTIAPDGRAIVVFGERGSTFGLQYVRLDTGETILLGSHRPSTAAVAWTPDGHYVLTLSEWRLAALDRTTNAIVEIDERLPRLSTFTLVPS
jgi:hypothetical protein